MTLHNPELIRQHNDYKAIQARLWGKKEKREPVYTPPVAPPICREPVDFSYHVKLYRWHLTLVGTTVHAELKAPAPTEYQPYPQEIVFDFSRPVKSMKEIAVEVLWDFPGVTMKDLKGHRRAMSITLPRQLAMYEIKVQRPDLSFPAIGRFFCRDHTTVLHAVRKIEALKGAANGK